MVEDSKAAPGRVHKTVEIVNRLGLHLRAAKAVVEAIAALNADVSICNGDRSANGRNILSLATLDAGVGTQLEIAATGPHAAEAVAAIEKLIAERFGEAE